MFSTRSPCFSRWDQWEQPKYTAEEIAKWQEQQAHRLVLALVDLAQAEVDRFAATCSVAADYCALRAEARVPPPPPGTLPEPVTVEVPAALEAGAAEAKLLEVIGAAAAALCELPDLTPPPPPDEGAAEEAEGGEEGADPLALRLTEWTGHLQKGVDGERAKLLRRLGAIGKMGCALLADLASEAEALHTQLDAWIGERVKRESAAAAALAAVMRKAAEAEEVLPHTLILEGDALVIDEALVLVPPPPPPPKAPVVQATTSNRFTVVQLEGLVAKLRASATGATLSAEGLAALLTRLGAATFDAAAPALPAAWRPLGASAYAQLAALYHAPGAAPQVAWPELIVGLSQLRTPTDAEIGAALNGAAKLAAAAAPAAAPAAAEEGEEAAAALEEATQEAPAAAAGGGAVLDRASYDALTLWFEGDYAAGEVEGEEGEYSVVGALKAVLFDIFATAEGDAPPKVDLQKLLLYCCGGAASAFGVLGHADGGLLSLAQLHDLFHREGAPDAAVGAPAHDDAFGTPALERLFAELKVDAASGRVAYKMVEGHPLGKQLLDGCVAYTPKDVYGFVDGLLGGLGRS